MGRCRIYARKAKGTDTCRRANHLGDLKPCGQLQEKRVAMAMTTAILSMAVSGRGEIEERKITAL